MKTVKITPSTDVIINQWEPIKGDSFQQFIDKNETLSPEEKNTVEKETLDILAKCICPSGDGEASNTGLVLGYVQSGKTLSFTSLAALAKDNGFKLVVVLAGTTTNLVEQSDNRISDDLGVKGSRAWRLFTTAQKKFGESEVKKLQVETEKWERRPDRARTVIVVVMKNHHHLTSFSKSIKNIDFSKIPTLIIDDEGDQAGLNNKASDNEESTTYAEIRKLRSVFPKHSFVAYTATPQANLLIRRIDELSPDFGKVISPGSAYTGGKEFFYENSPYLVEIPHAEVLDRDEIPDSPPKSLVDAIRIFLIGVAIGMLDGDDQKGKNRSMMIHPAVNKDDHLIYTRWVEAILGSWKDVFNSSSEEEKEKLNNSISEDISKLAKTHPIKYSDQEITEEFIAVLHEVVVDELNTRITPKIKQIDWEEYGSILIGGKALDRGFTIEGLTVSYMPRKVGFGNIDNIQQRARFFGYKKAYKGLCRLFLTEENIDAFKDYVEHEEEMRRDLKTSLEKGISLKEWKRRFFNNNNLNLTRASVIMLDVEKRRLGDRNGWIVPKHPFMRESDIDNNWDVLNDFLASIDTKQYTKEGWTEKQSIPHAATGLSLTKIANLLAGLQFSEPVDSHQNDILIAFLYFLSLKKKEITCSFLGLSGTWTGVDSFRSLNDEMPPRIVKLFQGRSRDGRYPGAANLVSSTQITVQLHGIDIINKDRTTFRSNVPIIAVHIPKHLMKYVWSEFV